MPLNNNDYVYTDSVHAYEVMLPSKPTPIDNLTSYDKTLKSIVMISTDLQTGTYYFCGINECNPGYVFQNDSSALHIVHDNLRKRYTNISLDTIYSENNRRIMEMNGSMMNNNSMLARAKVILRGNRYYTLLIMYTPGKWDQKMEKTLASFHPINNRESQWSSKMAPDSLFTTWAPAGFFYLNTKDSNATSQIPQYECFDSNRVHVYIMRVDELDKYLWKKNESAFWEYEKNKFVGSSDTLLSERMIRKDGLYQYEFLYQAQNQSQYRTRAHVVARESGVPDGYSAGTRDHSE